MANAFQGCSAPKTKQKRNFNKNNEVKKKGSGVKALVAACLFQGPQGACSLRQLHPTVGRQRRLTPGTDSQDNPNEVQRLYPPSHKKVVTFRPRAR